MCTSVAVVKWMYPLLSLLELSFKFYNTSRLLYFRCPPHQRCPTSLLNNMSKLVFLDLCAWQHSTEEIETSDLVFNGGEGGVVHLKQRPLQCHSFVNMACINNVAASLKAPNADGYPVRQRCLEGMTVCVLYSFQTFNSCIMKWP